MATLYYKGSGEVTEPLTRKPASMTRREWRALVKNGKRAVKRHAKEQARLPESVKLDNRLHAAGLISPRDARAVVPVRFGTQMVLGV